MTAILSVIRGHSVLAHRPFDQMPQGASDTWRRQHSPEGMTLNHWQSHSLPMGSVHDPDFRIFHADPGYYEDSINHENGPLISPPMGYVPETHWGSDVDMGTPSTAGYPDGPLESYQPVRHSHHLNLPPQHHERVQSSVHSPRSSYGEHLPVKEERPNLIRSITAPAAPDHRPKRVTNASGTPSIKRSGSEDDDDEYTPNHHDDSNHKPRGRKRQRIPHTAVERRYRENLNAHLDKLRQTVPSLASKRPPGASKSGDAMTEGVKPSKCEVLNGAIEHISALGKENAALKTEVTALRSRLEDLERWCGASGYGK